MHITMKKSIKLTPFFFLKINFFMNMYARGNRIMYKAHDCRVNHEEQDLNLD